MAIDFTPTCRYSEALLSAPTKGKGSFISCGHRLVKYTRNTSLRNGKVYIISSIILLLTSASLCVWQVVQIVKAIAITYKSPHIGNAI